LNCGRFRAISRFVISAITVSVLLSSCVYFNTMYNARRIYSEAEDKRKKGKTGRQLIGEYDKVIEKCSQLIRDHPESSWVDDAVFLMGLALIRQEKPDKAARKFQELISNFPESDYVPESIYWLAYAYLERTDYNQALVYTERFLNKYPQHELRYSVMFLAGDIKRNLKLPEEALNYYSMVAEESSKREVVDESREKSGELFLELGDWENAAANFEMALRKGITWEVRHRISLSLGVCYANIGRCREALDLFNELLDEAATVREKPPVLIGVASAYVCMDSLTTALSVYKDIAKEFPKSDYSAEAYYRMGVIYHERMDSLQNAQEAYSKVGSESASSEFAQIALQKSSSLKRLIELQKTADEGETREQIAEKRFLTAEVQLTRLEEVEAAITNYEAVIDSFPETAVAPKAYYALGWIYEKELGESEAAIEKYRELALQYPRSPQAKGAVNQIGRLGRAELEEMMRAYVDSALADTTAIGAGSGLEPDSALIDITPLHPVPVMESDTARSDTAAAGPEPELVPDAALADTTAIGAGSGLEPDSALIDITPLHPVPVIGSDTARSDTAAAGPEPELVSDAAPTDTAAVVPEGWIEADTALAVPRQPRPFPAGEGSAGRDSTAVDGATPADTSGRSKERERLE